MLLLRFLRRTFILHWPQGICGRILNPQRPMWVTFSPNELMHGIVVQEPLLVSSQRVIFQIFNLEKNIPFVLHSGWWYPKYWKGVAPIINVSQANFHHFVVKSGMRRILRSMFLLCLFTKGTDTQLNHIWVNFCCYKCGIICP